MTACRSSTQSDSRCCTSEVRARGIVACIARPTAKSRWMTWSCRSRAIRSRSARTSSSRAKRCEVASCQASAAWSANAAIISSCSGLNGVAFRRKCNQARRRRCRWREGAEPVRAGTGIDARESSLSNRRGVPSKKASPTDRSAVSLSLLCQPIGYRTGRLRPPAVQRRRRTACQRRSEPPPKSLEPLSVSALRRR